MFTLNRHTIYSQNVGNGDRLIRLVASATLIGVFMIFQTTASKFYSPLALLAIPIAITAMMKWDPIYAWLKWNTSKNRAYHPVFTATNVGRIDRYIRYGLATALIAGFALFTPTPVAWTTVLALIAIPIAATAITGWCPFYASTGVSTSKPVAKRDNVVYPEFTGPVAPRPNRPAQGHGRKAA